MGLEAAGLRYTGMGNIEADLLVATQALWAVMGWKLWSRGESSTGWANDKKIGFFNRNLFVLLLFNLNLVA